MAAQTAELLGFGRDIFSEEHEAYRTTARRFFRREVEPNIRQWQKDGFFPAELFRKAGEAGLLCAGIPEEYGGGGGDFLHHAILYEEHGYSPAGAAIEAGVCTDTAAYVMLHGGTEEQKMEWLPRFAAGEVISEVGVTEGHSGSDPRSMRTTARRDGGDYVINGSKMWMTNGPIMTMLVVAARTGENLDGRGSVSMFIVPVKETKGVTVTKPTELMLKSAGGVAEVFFEDVRIPAENLLGGQEGRGMANALGTITIARLAQSARMLAACELAFQMTVEFVKNRKAFGQRVFDFQNTQFKLAQLKTEITVGRAFLDNTLKRNVSGVVDPVEGSMAKLWISELEGRVMDECLQLHGGAGFSDEFPISKMYAFARVHRLYLGTSEIQRLTIARTI
ncbi:MAG TPA: acyl-CoA dehydrogenase family protein [Rhizomicrobium sp.]|nr:acyl-CoA dehydrogenase family protein [Rhizomicrobium sp.]